jgi:hypothetical protein
VPSSEFRALDLRAHQFLSDVPLHDVWRIQLRRGGPNLTVPDVLRAFVDVASSGVGPVARALFGLRSMLGRAFGWDREVADAAARSYLNRLSDDDRARSLEAPGSKRFFWTTLYTFEREGVGEVINRTVHSFLLFALVPTAGGHTLYWATYVKPVSRFTPYYMASIDPFRRLLIYPSLIRRFEETWNAAAR